MKWLLTLILASSLVNVSRITREQLHPVSRHIVSSVGELRQRDDFAGLSFRELTQAAWRSYNSRLLAHGAEVGLTLPVKRVVRRLVRRVVRHHVTVTPRPKYSGLQLNLSKLGSPFALIPAIENRGDDFSGAGSGGTVPSLFPVPVANTYYTSPTGGGTACTVISTPCDLRDVLGQRNGITVTVGSTVYMRDGVYKGKYLSTINGTTGQSDTTVRSYPGEWAIIDGYSTTTLSSTFVTVDANHSRVHLTANPGLISDGGPGSLITSFIVVDQPDAASNEGCAVDTVEAANSYLVVCVPSLSHSIGATVTTSGDNLTINGHDVIYRDFEVRNSDPIRTQTPLDSQRAPNNRGIGIWLAGKNQLVNLVVHDTANGLFSTSNASGSRVYGCLFYNNGYIAGGVRNGHGTYDQNNDAANPFLIQEDISFNNFAVGIKGESQNANTIGIAVSGVVAFNNGPYETNPLQRRGGVLLGANNGTADQVSMDSCFLYDPTGTLGGAGGVGPFTGNTGTGSVTNNWFASGSGTGFSGVATSVTITGNTVLKYPGGSYIMSVKSSTSPSTINNQTYYDTSGLSTPFTQQEVANYNFANWKSTTGYDAASTYSTSAPSLNWVFTRPNDYDPTRWNLTIFNHQGLATVSVPIPAGWVNGDTWAFTAVETGAWHGPITTPTQTGTVTGGVIAISMSANTVVGPIGLGQAADSMAPAFTTGLLIRTSQTANAASTTTGKATKTGKVTSQ